MGVFILAAAFLTLLACHRPREYLYFCPTPPTCFRCGYDLSGSIGAHSCPECGLDWTSATMRVQASSRTRIDGPSVARALVGWLIGAIYAACSYPIATALYTLRYWTSGYRHINFANVVRGDLERMLPIGATPFTLLALLCLPILFARNRVRLALKLLLIAFIIDTAIWALPLWR